MKQWPGVNIQIGKNAEVDEDVIIGYLSGRLKVPGGVIIGDNVRLRSGTVVYQEVKIGHNFQTGHHVIVRENNEIGNSVQIWANAIIDYNCRIGNTVKIHSNVYIPQGTVIEDEVFIAPGTCCANDKYPPSGGYHQPPYIKKGASLGVNVTLLPGVVIGKGALVGAGSVVIKDVPDGVAVAGNPARVIARADEISEKKKKLISSWKR